MLIDRFLPKVTCLWILLSQSLLSCFEFLAIFSVNNPFTFWPTVVKNLMSSSWIH
jgi:hypothetical protein